MRNSVPAVRFHRALTCALSAVVGIGAVSLGCGGDDEATTTSVPATGGGGSSQGGGGQGGGQGGAEVESLVVEVATTTLGAFGEFEPVAGAVVAFDKPGGERVELTSGADGLVTFEGIDWSLGDGNMTGYLEGHILWSYLGLNPESLTDYIADGGAERLRIPLIFAGGETVAVSGTATGMVDEAHRFFVGSTVGGTNGDGVGPNWELEVPTAEAFSLVGFEYHPVAPATVSARGEEFAVDGWASLDHEAVTAETSGLVLDMTNALTPTTVSGSFALPSHGISDFFQTARSLVRVSSADSGYRAILGLPTHSDVSADETALEYELEYVSPTAVESPMTDYTLYKSDGSAGGVVEPTNPVPGAQDFVVPEPVTLDSTTTRPYQEPISWQMNEVDAADSALTVNAWINISATKESVWYVRMPRRTTTLSLPTPPSTVELDAVFGTGALLATIQLCETRLTPGYEGYCARYSAARPVRLSR